MEWAFAITAVISVLFLFAVVGTLTSAQDFELRMGSYHYKGPFWACWPVMGIGLMALAGTAGFVILNVLVGRSIARHESEQGRTGMSVQRTGANSKRVQ